jgi:N-carbamoylputrescine amidase
MMIGRIKVAAVQMKNNPADKTKNFRRAELLIREAQSQGATTILLPELSPGGYLASEAVWSLGENERGPTTCWQTGLSRELGITLGAGFPLWQGDDLINVYQLSNSQGELWGQIQKVKTETDVFLPGQPGDLLDTDTGRVGLGICADNHMVSFLKKVKMQAPDWMAMPHAWPVPVRAGGPVSEKDIEKAKADMNLFPSLYSRTLGVPVVFVNAVGPMMPMSGSIGRLMDPRYFALGGHSVILDREGQCLASLADEEGVIVAEIETGTQGSGGPIPEDYDGWLHKGNLIMRKVLMPLGNLTSRRRYRQQQAARAQFARAAQNRERG